MRIRDLALAAFFLRLVFPSSLVSQWIAVNGTWNLNITSANLQGAPGSNLIDTYTSTMGDVTIDVNGTTFKKTWRVDVHKEDISWDSNFHLDVQRAAFPNLIGGTTYSEITNTDREFFHTTARKNAVGIQLQYRLRSVSSTFLYAATYSVRIVYTLVDT